VVCCCLNASRRQAPRSLPRPPHNRRLVAQYGEGNWSAIARALNKLLAQEEDGGGGGSSGAEPTDGSVGRVGKQCRERWNHHLRPDISKAAWTPDEEEAMVQAHRRWVGWW